MNDIFDRIKNNPGPLGQFAEYGEGNFIFPKLEGEIGPRMIFNGKEVVCWSINNYLGLANHPEVRKADADAAKEWGLSYPMGARAMSGQTKYHEELEKNLADFMGKESAYLLNFGYQGMVSIVDSLLSKNDVVVYDVDSHACIVDGVRMHLGKRFTFKHNDIESLEKNLQRASKIVSEDKRGGILVISEGVFGMRGEQGKLKEIVKLKEKYNFRFLVDDAHGFGMLGETGAGAGEEQGVLDGIDVYFSTFAKSMASIGAFVAGDKEVITYLKYGMRSQIFAKSLPMPIVIGALKRLELLKTQPILRKKLWENVNILQSGLKAAGFNLGSTNSCVTPVYLNGGAIEGTIMVQDLRENYNIFISIVSYPVIPKGMILLRLIPTAEHSLQDIEETLLAFKAVRSKLENGEYKKIADQLNLGLN
ncbi:MAG: aminotransferase class I/II-fold pyridoxal phosphate-dependent enzyme [Solirubrobacteraceae bacterium]